MKRVSLAVMLLAAIALVVNTVFVDSRTRPAMARDGGQLIETPVVTANVKVEGNGPAIVFIHGFGAAIDWWDEIAPTLAKDHRALLGAQLGECLLVRALDIVRRSSAEHVSVALQCLLVIHWSHLLYGRRSGAREVRKLNMWPLMDVYGMVRPLCSSPGQVATSASCRCRVSSAITFHSVVLPGRKS